MTAAFATKCIFSTLAFSSLVSATAAQAQNWPQHNFGPHPGSTPMYSAPRGYGAPSGYVFREPTPWGYGLREVGGRVIQQAPGMVGRAGRFVRPGVPGVLFMPQCVGEGCY